MWLRQPNSLLVEKETSELVMLLMDNVTLKLNKSFLKCFPTDVVIPGNYSQENFIVIAALTN